MTESRPKRFLTGIVVKKNEKGFGFIAVDSQKPNTKDLFFHSDELTHQSFDELQCGQAVTFELAATKYGPKAINVGPLGEILKLTNHLELPAPPPVVVIRALQECTAELMEYLTKHPDALRHLHPGTFENLIEEIFHYEGFDTERISGWNEPDGGVDLIAVRHLSSGFDIRLAIQCKRWAQSRKLSAEPIRTLAGVLDRFRAHAGVVATTGIFSEEAEQEMTSYLWRISLRDYNAILASLKRLRLTQ